nr:NADH dehydrogenase subunit 6 [Phytobia cambii]
MMQLIMYSMIIMFSFIFMQMKHPLSMGLMLLVQTMTMCIITGIMSKTFWFSYILFLIFLGGMLVLFIYMTSLASNEMFSFSMKLMLMMIMFMMMIMIMIIFMDKLYFINFFSNMEMNNLNNLTNYIYENSMSLNKLYNYPTNMTTILLMNYLLITLIASVKITNLFFGPLRMMN